jgi:hypothetical protein
MFSLNKIGEQEGRFCPNIHMNKCKNNKLKNGPKKRAQPTKLARGLEIEGGG